MDSKVFGELKYHTGWETERCIPYVTKKITIVIHAKAHGVTEEITQEQEDVFRYFEDNLSSIMKQIEDALRKDSGENFEKRYPPAMLLIKKDGKSALLFDDATDIENGLAVSFMPDIRIMTQDEFL